jgi:8-oxo-dGTP pyrophosphatase MutT (NUDIX family)
MREIQRTIVSALIFSKDGKLLMGKKDPAKGGVYPDSWHIPGGGIDEEETFERALRREVGEEVGIDISLYNPVLIPEKGSGIAEKTLPSGEKVLCRMEFNIFRVDIHDKLASEIEITLSDDLVEIRWFGPEELPEVKQIPGGKEYFQKIGLIPKDR